jgi:PAS domain S-box-containing protein
MAVDKFPDEVTTIRQLLSGHTEGLTIRSISAMLGMNRNSVAKYLDILQMQGGVTLKRSGPSKIYCLADKLPAAAVLRLAKSHVIIFNQTLLVTDINDSFLEFLKCSKKDIVGKSPDLLPFAMQCQPELPMLIKEGIRGRENRIAAMIRMGDNAVPVILTCSPVFFENGNNGVSLTIDPEQDQKNRKISGFGTESTSTELDVSEYLCRFAPDGTLTYVNAAYCDLLHKTKTELIGHTWRPTIPESEVKKIKTCLHALNHANPVASLDLRAITPAGDSQWQRWKFRHLYDQQGLSAGYQGTGLNITELKKLEQKVSKFTDEMENLIHERRTEIQDLNRQIYDEITSHEKTHFQLQFTQFAMDAASYMITWISREGRFIYMNRQAQQVLGYQYRDVISKKFQDLIADVFPFPWDEIWEIIKQDSQYTIETALRTSNGIEIPVEMVLNYLEFKDKQYCCCFAKDISGRKRAEEALRESEQKYRDIFEKSVSGLFKTTPDGRLVDANDAFARMYGYSSAGEMLAAGLDVGRDLYANPEDRKEVLNFLAEKGKVEHYEAEHFKRDGTLFWVAITARAIRDADGTVIFYEGTYVDITGRKRAEDALRYSEARLNTLVKTIPDLIWLKDRDGVYLSCNPMFERFIGAHESDIVGKTDYTFVDHNLADFFREQDRKAMAAGKPTSNEEWVTFSDDGHRALLDTIKTPMYDDHGTLIGVLGIGRDITGRKRAEEALSEVAQYTRNIIESSLDPLVTISPEGRITDVNTATESVTGYSRNHLIGTDFSDYFTVPEDARKGYQKVFDQGVVRNYPLDIKNRDGTIRHMLYNAAVYRDGAGRVKGVFAAARDITERRHAEAELQLHGEIVQNMAEGVLMTRISDRKIVYANPRFEHLFGYLPGELTGRNISTINAPGTTSADSITDTIISKLILTGMWSGDLHSIRKDKQTFWCHATVSTFDHQQFGKVWVSVHMDITDRKQAEEALQEKIRHDLMLSHNHLQRTQADLQLHQTELEVQNEELRRTQASLEQSHERYFELYDLAPAGYLTINEKGLIHTANLTAATQLGVERYMLEKKPFTRYIVPEDQDIFYHCRNELVRTKMRQLCELRMLHAGDSPFRVQIIAVPALSEEGEMAAISLMVIDITTLKKAQDALRTNEWDFHIMFGSHQSVMLLIEPGTGKIIDANRAAERFFGKSIPELCSLSLDAVNSLPPEELSRKRKMAAEGEVTVFQYQHRLSGGESRIAEVHLSPVTLEGRIILFSIIHDVTDREAEEEQPDEARHGNTVLHDGARRRHVATDNSG